MLRKRWQMDNLIEVRLIGLGVQKNYVRYIVKVLRSMWLWAANTWRRAFKSHDLRRGKASSGEQFYWERGDTFRHREVGSHYARLLLWNFFVSLTGYYKIFYRILIFIALLLYHFIYIINSSFQMYILPTFVL